jgi:hypothetical protein
MPVAAGDLWQMTVQMTCLGQIFENVIMMRDRNISPSSDAAIKAAGQQFWTLYRKLISHQVTCQAILLKRVTPVLFDSLITGPASGEAAGTEPDDPMNSTVAMVTTLRTGVAGKTHRGRVYTPGVATGAAGSFSNVLTSSAQTRYQGYWNDIMTEFDDATGASLTLALGIYSRLIGGTSPYTVAGWQAVTQPAVQFVLGNQRRRRLGVGA